MAQSSGVFVHSSGSSEADAAVMMSVVAPTVTATGTDSTATAAAGIRGLKRNQIINKSLPIIDNNSIETHLNHQQNDECDHNQHKWSEIHHDSFLILLSVTDNDQLKRI